MANPFTVEAAPYGPSAPAQDMLSVAAPASDTALSSPGRCFLVLTAGTVSVTTLAGNNRTFTAAAGMTVPVCITHVLAATTSDLLVYVD